MENKNTGLIIAIVILSILVVGLGGFIVYDKILSNENVNSQENQNINNENINNTEESDESIVSLTNDDKIKINNKLNQPNQITFASGLYWIPNNTEENFNTIDSKLLFLSNMVVTYGDVVTDTQTNKTYYKLSSVQQKANEYFGEEINISNLSLEYYNEPKYSDYIYIEYGERKMEILNPIFKTVKIVYDKSSKLHTLYVDILEDGREYDTDDTIYGNEYLNYDESLVLAKGEIKYKKSENSDNYYLVSFKYINK